MRYVYLIIISLILIPSAALLGQEENDCGVILMDARDRYDAGIVEEVPGLLEDCLKEGFSKEDQLEAYKLVINSYLFDGFPEEADSVMQAMLQEFPNYEPTAADPAEFQLLMSTYDTDPYLSTGASAGGNAVFPILVESVGISDPLEDNGKYSMSSIGFQAAGLLHIRIFHNAELGLELQYQRLQFSHMADPLSFTRYNYNEVQDHLSLPVSFIYMFSPNRIVKPYIRGGIQADFLISATADITRSYLETGDAVFKDIKEASTKITDNRKRINAQVFAGAGLRFKLSKSYIFLDARYAFGIRTLNTPESRYFPDQNLTWLTYYVDNDFRLTYAAISVGYIRNFYNPKKK